MKTDRLMFVVPGKLPTLNEYTNSNRTHWGSGASVKKNATQAVMYACMNVQIPEDNKIMLHYTWHTSTRHDFDNIAFAQKFIQDGLVDAGKIPNDSRKYIIGFTHNFEIVKKGLDCVVVKIELC